MNRAELVEQNHPQLSVREQCELLGVSRSSSTYRRVEEPAETTQMGIETIWCRPRRTSLADA
ncbi:MAG: hypothetical protein WEC73_05985, partial [Chthoniobacterales bacterium]